MLAYLLAFSIICGTASEKVQEAIESYVDTNFKSENGEYHFDYRRINWNQLPSEFDSVRVFRIGKDTPLGNTIFTLGIYRENDLIKAVPVSVNVTLIVNAVVTSVPVNTGEKLLDVKIDKRLITSKSQFPVTDPAGLQGKQARRYIPAGSTIYPSMLELVPVINTGDKVNIVIEKGLIKVTAEGVARQKGGVGDIIKVVNLGSRKVVRAEIVDSSTVALK